MSLISCIFGCGYMRNFTSPIVWKWRPEGIEIMLNADGRICDKCGAIALVPENARKIHDQVVGWTG